MGQKSKASTEESTPQWTGSAAGTSQIASGLDGMNAESNRTIPITLDESEQISDHFIAYVGPPEAMLSAVDVTDYRPRLQIIPVWLPGTLEQLGFWIFSVSAALALLNMLPVVFLDGAVALQAALDLRPADVSTGVELLPFEGRRSCATPVLRLLVHRWAVRTSTTLFLIVILSKFAALRQ